MKKTFILLSCFALLALSNMEFAFAQNRVTYSIQNRLLVGNVYSADIWATPNGSNSWEVGNTFIRVFYNNSALSDVAYNGTNAANINSSLVALNYAVTENHFGSNSTRLAAQESTIRFTTTGSFRIATLQWTVTDGTALDNLSITSASTVVYNGVTQLNYNCGDNSCYNFSSPTPIVINSAGAVPPTVSISGSTTFCAGSGTTLTATGATTYVWSNGSTSASINVSVAGTFTVTGANANGTSTASVSVTVKALPILTMSGNNTFCAGGSTQLTASGSGVVSYIWSTGATSASISVNSAGNYIVYGQNLDGCFGSTSISVSVISTVSAPTLSSPTNGSTSVSTNPTLSWQTVSGAASYTLQVSTQTNFSVFTYNQGSLTGISQGISGLNGLTQYFWRVQSVNSCTSSSWSSTFAFTTASTATINAPPSTWNFVSNTGNFATIAIPTNANPRVNNVSLTVGDAIGVFYTTNNTLVCGGWGYWQPGQSMALTAWGDNEQTLIKDGFASGEVFTYKIWKASESKEYNATATYSLGNGLYTANGLYVLSGIVGYGQHDITLTSGWNHISSYINPSADIESVCSLIAGGITIVRNGSGQVFWPSQNINTIHTWNTIHGYQFYMTTSATLSIQGTMVSPESTTINLYPSQWGLISYLRNTAMWAPTALASLGTSLVIIKNGGGQVYWPAWGVNTINNMQPGQGYWAYVSSTSALTYPSNSPRAGENNLTYSNETKHYSIDFQKTSVNQILMVHCLNAKDNDEVAVWNSRNEIVGTGLVLSQKALVTVWGNDAFSGDGIGAKEGEFLRFSLWKSDFEQEITLPVSSVVNVLKNGETEIGAIYKSDGVLEVSTQIPEYSAQNSQLSCVPNPSTGFAMISYFVAEKSNVQVEIYDILSQKILTLVNDEQSTGMKNIGVDMSEKPSGTYFVRLVAGKNVQTIKIELVK